MWCSSNCSKETTSHPARDGNNEAGGTTLILGGNDPHPVRGGNFSVKLLMLILHEIIYTPQRGRKQRIKAFQPFPHAGNNPPRKGTHQRKGGVTEFAETDPAGHLWVSAARHRKAALPRRRRQWHAQPAGAGRFSGRFGRRRKKFSAACSCTTPPSCAPRRRRRTIYPGSRALPTISRRGGPAGGRGGRGRNVPAVYTARKRFHASQRRAPGSFHRAVSAGRHAPHARASRRGAQR